MRGCHDVGERLYPLPIIPDSFGITGHSMRECVAATWNAAAEGSPVTTDEMVELIKGILGLVLI